MDKPPLAKLSCIRDFVEAENSLGFHAPEKAARILGESINFTRLGQMAWRGEKPTEIPAAKTEPKK